MIMSFFEMRGASPRPRILSLRSANAIAKALNEIKAKEYPLTIPAESRDDIILFAAANAGRKATNEIPR